MTPYSLILSPYAQIVPLADGLMAKTRAGVAVLQSPRLAGCSSALVELLAAGHSGPDIAQRLDLQAPLVEEVLRELQRHRLVAPGRPAGSADDLARSPGRRLRTRRRVVLAGLGELGVNLLHRLCAENKVQIWLYDPSPDRARAVRGAIAPKARSRVRILGARAHDPSEFAEAVRGAVGRPDLIVCCADQPGRILSVVTEAARALGAALLPVQLQAARAQIGPMSSADAEHDPHGCVLCTAAEMERADRFATVLSSHIESHRVDRVRWRYRCDPSAVALAADLAAACAWDVLASPGRVSRCVGKARLVGFRDGDVQEALVPRSGACRVCTKQEEVTPCAGPEEAACAWRDKTARERAALPFQEIVQRVASLASRPWGPLRGCQAMTPDLRGLVHQYFEARGLRPDGSILPNFHHVNTPMRELGTAASGLHFFSEEHARLCSLAEAIERTAFLVPRTLRTTYAPLEALSHDAIDPRDHPLYGASQYRQEGFGVQPFDPRAPIHWIWGVDASTGAPVLVPESLVHVSTRDDRLFHLTSSGTAVHSQFHRAVLGALYEVVERDAFMLTWMHRWSRPRASVSVDPFGLTREWTTAGFRLSWVDLTTDLGIPVLFVAARDQHDPDVYLNTFCAGPSPTAIMTSLHRELAQGLLGRIGRGPSAVTRETDPRTVVSIRDHAEFYQDRAKTPLLDFLTASDVVSRFDSHDYFTACAGADPAVELAQATKRLGARGFRVVVVDLTPPWMAALGLHAVRVVIPGLQPIHFGHHTRVLGGRRLYEAPRLLGLLDRDVSVSELNPWEHPFA